MGMFHAVKLPSGILQYFHSLSLSLFSYFPRYPVSISESPPCEIPWSPDVLKVPVKNNPIELSHENYIKQTFFIGSSMAFNGFSMVFHGRDDLVPVQWSKVPRCGIALKPSMPWKPWRRFAPGNGLLNGTRRKCRDVCVLNGFKRPDLSVYLLNI